ncbi:MAG: hypothetical protein M0042_06510 [Nitrospiraceae bacterium]|nr:hypothetical protein [Nitrospiraceae bacterium]
MIDFAKIANRKVLIFDGMRLQVRGTDLYVNSGVGVYLIGKMGMVDFIKRFTEGLEAIEKHLPRLKETDMPIRTRDKIARKLIVDTIFSSRLNGKEVTFDKEILTDFKNLYSIIPFLSPYFKKDDEKEQQLKMIFDFSPSRLEQFVKYKHLMDMQ